MSKMKFPDKHYVGFQKRNSDIMLGFMTPYGTDAAAKKRMGTVDAWARQNTRTYDHTSKTYIEHGEIPAVTYENVPLSGFFVGTSIKHSSRWGSGGDKWRIEDPRGFELEINSGNFEEIVRRCTIIQGKIQEQCIWARLGAQNILVPVHTDEYQETLRNTKIAKKKESIRDAKPGDLLVLQNGEEGIYMGYYYFIEHAGGNYYSNDGIPLSIKVGTRKRHVFRKPANKHQYFSYAEAKIAEIHPKDVIENPIDEINNGRVEAGSNDYNSKWDIHSTVDYGVIGVTDTREIEWKLEIQQMDYEDAKSSGHRTAYAHYDPETLFTVGFSSYGSYNTYPRRISMYDLYNTNFERKHSNRSYSYGYYSRQDYVVDKPEKVYVRQLTFEVNGYKYSYKE